MTKPDPSAEERRGRSPGPPLRSWNSRKKSSKGEPSGTMPCGPVRPATVVDVVMLTTAGLMRSASLEKLSGAFCADAISVCDTIRNIDTAASQNSRSGLAESRVTASACGFTWFTWNSFSAAAARAKPRATALPSHDEANIGAFRRHQRKGCRASSACENPVMVAKVWTAPAPSGIVWKSERLGPYIACQTSSRWHPCRRKNLTNSA